MARARLSELSVRGLLELKHVAERDILDTLTRLQANTGMRVLGVDVDVESVEEFGDGNPYSVLRRVEIRLSTDLSAYAEDEE